MEAKTTKKSTKPTPGRKPDFSMPEKVANWGGLPGNTQPRSRSGGDRKVKIHPKSEGI
jgi:hypothetical protein